MDHVIESLRRWKEIYEEDPEEERDTRAIQCIEKALAELNKYYKKKY